MSSKVTIRQSKGVSVVGLLTLIAGVVLILAGGVTWWAVSDKLSQEGITVSDDASFLAGRHVNDPFSAFAQAEVINKHALAMTDGKTYAELPQDDPRRETVMNASFLRASLFTSVVSFGVAALVMGLGVLFILVGWALRRLAGGPPVIVETTGAHGAHALAPQAPAAAGPRHQSPPSATAETAADAAPAAPAAAAAPLAPTATPPAAAPEDPIRRSRSERSVPTSSPSPAGERPEASTTRTPVFGSSDADGAAPDSAASASPAPVTTPPVTQPAAPQTPAEPAVPTDAPQADERPAGWASPADRVPPVESTSDENGTTK
ncbi:hypothetical protein SAMN05216410_1649 [Sanguibacter gelidistatuariae]|uniref:Uncharacterized protein n=1 Tax=Sanguibacter gelidistatuariae TaxID=1814289 RepID=A0A1G6KQ09_9MICO|nr:hypothetical protein SAMN05216410_1649 [Sanguibacter gelidistatuariae]